jgi:hypothetical protein
LSVNGKTWRKLSSRETVQRSLVSKGSGANDLATVVSGTAPYTQLAQFVRDLRPVPTS